MGSPIWAPHPDNKPQNQAFESLADETMFGGAGGGGKSDLLLGLGLTRHKKTIVFRRQQRDTKALIDRGEEIVGSFGRWVSHSHSFKTNDNREVEFGHCNRPGDEKAHQGHPHDLKAFDELAHFTEDQYVWLSAWNRSSDPNQRCRVVGASNPPMTAEGFWIVRRWAAWLDAKHPNPAKPGELRWYAMIDGKDTEVTGPQTIEHRAKDGTVEIIQPRSRTFIPSRVDDNPYYRNSGYKAVLQSLPEPMRSALLHGKFDAAMEDDPWQVIPTAWVEAAMARWTPKAPGPMCTIGVDPAMGGRDRMALARRHDTWFAELVTIPGVEVPTGVAAAGYVVRFVRDGAPAQVDTIGIGAACFEHLKTMNLPTAAMDAREATLERDRSGALGFVNKRSWWWWAMREALDPETGDDLALPNDAELKADLCAPTWKPTPRGVQVESKEDIGERLGRSTDKGDAVVMALPQIVPPVPKRRSIRSESNSGSFMAG